MPDFIIEKDTLVAFVVAIVIVWIVWTGVASYIKIKKDD